MIIFIAILINIFIYQFKSQAFIKINLNNQFSIYEMARQIKLIKIHQSLSYFYSNFIFLFNQ